MRCKSEVGLPTKIKYLYERYNAGCNETVTLHREAESVNPEGVCQPRGLVGYYIPMLVRQGGAETPVTLCLSATTMMHFKMDTITVVVAVKQCNGGAWRLGRSFHGAIRSDFIILCAVKGQSSMRHPQS